MTMPVQPVTCRFFDQDGSPIAAKVSFKLTTQEIYNGIVVGPQADYVICNASTGIGVINLFPNALGANSSQYTVKAVDSVTGRKILPETLCTIPDSPCYLDLILNQEPFPTLSASSIALAGAQAATATATAQADIAVAQATIAVTQAGIASTQAGISTAKAVLTAADAVATAADRVATGLDVLATDANKVQTIADRAQTALDRIATAADVVLTHAGVLTATGLAANTAADRTQTGLDRTAAAASELAASASEGTASAQAAIAVTQAGIATAKAVLTAADLVGTNANVLLTDANAAATAADRTQTGLDRTAASASASTATAQASIATDQAVLATSNGAAQVALATTQANTATTQAGLAAADRTQTGLDRIQTAADRVQTGLDRVSTTASAAASLASQAAANTSAGAASGSAASALAVYGTSNAMAAALATAQAQASAAAASAASANTAKDLALTAWAAATYPGETLGALSQSLHVGTVVKAIVYDTSKDSDGGAWRKRCADKSWYTETLGGTRWVGQALNEATARGIAAGTTGDELVTNGDFSNGTTGWNLGTGSGAMSNVAGLLRITATADGLTTLIATSAIATTIGKTYTIFCGTATKTAVNVFQINASNNINGSSAFLSTNFGSLGAGTVNNARAIFTATATTTYVVLRADTSAANVTGAYAEFDNISVKEVNTAIDTRGAAYQNTTDGKFYKLHTNLQSNTEQLDSGFFTKANSTIAANAVAAPDGTITADKLIMNAGRDPAIGTSSGLTFGNIDLTPSASYTQSIYAKTGELSVLRLRSNATNQHFDIPIAGPATAPTGTITACTVTPVGNGWSRITWSFVATGSVPGNRGDHWGIRSASTGDGTSGFYLWGAQLEQGSTATTYEAKTTSTTAGTTEVFRGITREFPAVAGIVAESARVVIYDLSTGAMWMVFIVTTSAMAGNMFTNYAPTSPCIAAGGARVYLGNGGSSDLLVAEFIRDVGLRYSASQSARTLVNIANRNSALAITSDPTMPLIISRSVNDVAITVLDNAPIDPATGLPTPTIAVATAGGVSVIRDNGTVVNIYPAAAAAMYRVGFIDNLLIMQGEYIDYSPWVMPIPATNVTGWSYQGQPPGTLEEYSATGTVLPAGTSLFYLGSSGGNNRPMLASKNSRVLSSAQGLSVVKPNPASPTKGMVSYITPTYNTGWMPGDIRLATLADTTAETVTGSGELVTNGTFDTDTTGWTATGNATLSVVAGQLVITNDGIGTMGGASQSITTVVGKTYSVSATNASGNTLYFGVGNTLGSVNLASNAALAGATTGVINFTATGTSSFVTLLTNSFTPSITRAWDNISVKLATPDRSVKNNGLIVKGTLTKTAVASGAGLVAYSGFNAANYLEQPYNSNLDFGTGDFCVMGWVKSSVLPGALSKLIDRAGYSGAYTGSVIRLIVLSTGYARFDISDDSFATSDSLSNGVNVVTGDWVFIVAARIGSSLQIYTNGLLSASGSVSAASASLSNSIANLRLGLGVNSSEQWTGSLALWRISATAPSADQIAHIYRTELPLFQANAQCTIAGTSAAVTALAYDDVTDLLHVGTSYGRSGFKDLLRVDSEATTTGSITSLSAQGGTVITGGTSAKVYVPAKYLRDELQRKSEARAALGRIPVFFDHDAVTSQVAFVLPKGYTTKAVYSAGLLKRVGSTKDYTVNTDGFVETVTFAVAPGNTVQVSIMAVRSN